MHVMLTGTLCGSLGKPSETVLDNMDSLSLESLAGIPMPLPSLSSQFIAKEDLNCRFVSTA